LTHDVVMQSVRAQPIHEERSPVDAIQLILSDHREVEKLFKEFERTEQAGDAGRKAEVVRSLVRELSVHASIEEQFVYPVLRERAGDARILDSLEEHHAAKLTLDELDALPPGHPRLAAKVRLLAESIRRHVHEEERDLLPALERALDAEQRRALGDTIARARKVVPTRPHPASPDTPPANFVISAFAAVLDRCRDTARSGGEMLRTIVELSARSGFDGSRRLAARARERLRGAGERGREAAAEVRARGREAADEVRAAVDRVEVRTTEAAREARRSGRAATRAAGAGRRAATREYRRGKSG
jgi:hemerythrin superfamily protein